MNMTVMTRRHRLEDVAHLPRRLHYPHGSAGSVTWHWQAVGVIVCVCHEGCGRLVVMVAVGKSGEAAGLVASMVVVVGMEQLSVDC